MTWGFQWLLLGLLFVRFVQLEFAQLGVVQVGVAPLEVVPVVVGKNTAPKSSRHEILVLAL